MLVGSRLASSGGLWWIILRSLVPARRLIYRTRKGRRGAAIVQLVDSRHLENPLVVEDLILSQRSDNIITAFLCADRI